MVAEYPQHAAQTQHVVPMSRPLPKLYAHVLTGLSSSIMAQWAWPSPEAGFATLIFHDALGASPLPQLDSWPADDRLIHSPSLAAAGYAIACGLAPGQSAAWLAGIERLRGREAFPSDRQSFAYRPVELLGIAAGVSQHHAANADLATWMSTILARSRKEHADDVWASGLQHAAEKMIGISGTRFRSVDECLRLEELALLKWLSKQFSLPIDERDLMQRLLEQGATEVLNQLDLPRTAVIFRALRDVVREAIESDVEQHWQIGRSQRDTEKLLLALCTRFHLFAEQLKLRHGSRQTIDVADEYDVQDLLHALLKLHFDDVRPEEVTPSVAGKSGRMDFLLKGEHVVVEVKMTRKGLDQKKVGDELIVDMRRYQAHPDVRTLICLVYDPGGYCTSPNALERDLTGMRDDLQTFVVVCPKGL